MPEDPELYNQLLREQIELQNSRRIEAALNRQRNADEAQPYSRYIGHDADTNRPLIARLGGTGSIGINRLSNAQPVAGELGRGFDNGFKVRRRRLGGDEPPSLKRGDVTVLARVLRAGKTELWIGGDRKTPIKIKEFTSSPDYLELEKTGSGINDWLVAYKVTATNTIGIISGLDEEDASWELIDPRATLLQYRGNGFWTSPSVVTYNGAFQDTTTINPSGSEPQIQGITCYSGIEGFTTISVAYCEDYEIAGTNPVVFNSGVTRSGFAPTALAAVPLPFDGQNEESETTISTRGYEGPISGPGFMGPGGQVCTLGSADIVGTQSLPTFRRTDVEQKTRTLSTQAYSVSAYAGEILLNQGTDSYSYQEDLTTVFPSGGELRTRTFSGQCSPFSTGPIWTIFVSGSTFWPNIPGTPSDDPEIDFSLSVTVPRRVAPEIDLTWIRTATGNEDTGSLTAEENEPDINFPSGYSYIRVIRSGSTTADQDGLNLIPAGTVTLFLSFRGSLYQLQNPLSLQFTYKDVASESYPVTTVAVPAFEGGDIFEGEKRYSVTESTAELISGKVEWTNSTTRERVASSMRRAANGATFANIVKARYWGK
jgi:hypothetical protein